MNTNEKKTYELSYTIDGRYTWKLIEAMSAADAKSQAPNRAKHITTKPAKQVVSGSRFGF